MANRVLFTGENCQILDGDYVVVVKVVLLGSVRVRGPKIGDSSHCTVKSKHGCVMLWRGSDFFGVGRFSQ